MQKVQFYDDDTPLILQTDASLGVILIQEESNQAVEAGGWIIRIATSTATLTLLAEESARISRQNGISNRTK